jgi:biopolymer transport protein ExbD
LSEINIAPLLDLGFVLLVIFIITTVPIVNDLQLELPTASSNPKDPPAKANFVTVEASGEMYLNKQKVTFEALLAELVQLRMADPDLNVVVRGDGKVKYRQIAKVMNALQRANVVKVDLATEVVASKKE